MVRRVLRVPAVVAVALVAAEVVGAGLVGVVLGVVLFVRGLRWWAVVVEPWLFAPRPARRTRVVHQPPPRPVEGTDHVAFARALALVAGRYLVECERRSIDRGTENGDRS
jgi:hypothetical protein